MQRTQDDGIIISCDFCGCDWDPYDEAFANPMIEGHHGSVICLSCVKQAVLHMAPADGNYACILCLRDDLTPDIARWRNANPPPGARINPQAIACRSCIKQAAGRFTKDPDVNWKWDRHASEEEA